MLAERLGYGPEERLLIVHADDLGLAQSVNAAFFRGFATGLINSGSVMVPCPWFAEVAAFVRAHPEADVGLHLTLTSESPEHPTTPVAPPTSIPSLVDKNGYFLAQWTVETRIDPGEVAVELRTQIQKALAAGLRPTHLDSHQYRAQLSGRAIFGVTRCLAHEYRLPVLISREWLTRADYLRSGLTPRDVVLDRVAIIHGNAAPERWSAFYSRVLTQLPPGVSEILIHPGYDNEELQAFFGGREPWGAAWRQRDFDFFTSDAFRDLLAQQRITLITWREITAGLSDAKRRRLGVSWLP